MGAFGSKDETQTKIESLEELKTELKKNAEQIQKACSDDLLLNLNQPLEQQGGTILSAALLLLKEQFEESILDIKLLKTVHKSCQKVSQANPQEQAVSKQEPTIFNLLKQISADLQRILDFLDSSKLDPQACWQWEALKIVNMDNFFINMAGKEDQSGAIRKTVNQAMRDQHLGPIFIICNP